MSKQVEKTYALPIAGPILVLILVMLVLFLAPVHEAEKKDATLILSSAGRIAELNNADLAGRPRYLSTDFSPDVSLTLKGGNSFDDQWETYPFLGDRVYTPRRPEDILSDFRDKKNLSVDQVRLLLDTILRTHTPEDAVGAMNMYLLHHTDDPEIRSFAADFFLERLLPKRAVAVTNERFHLILDKMKKEEDEKKKIALSLKAQQCIHRMGEIFSAYLLKFDTLNMTRRLIAACPENESLLFNHLDELIEKKQYDQALEALETNEAGQEKNFVRVLNIKSRIFEGQGEIDQAILLYENHPKLMEKSNGLFSDFLSLLARAHRTDTWRKSLIQRTRAGFDLPAIKRLFFYYIAQGDTRLLIEQLDIAEKHAKAQEIKPEELKELSDLCLQAGSSDLIARAVLYRWNLLVLAETPEEKQKAAVSLAEVLVRSDRPAPIPVAQSLAGAARIHFLDQYPGLAGGVLSLDLNLRGTAERFAALKDAGNRYENMRLALELAIPHFNSDSPQEIASTAARVLEKVYRKLDLDDLFVQTLVRYLQLFPDSEDAPDVFWKLADYYRNKKDTEAEERYLRQLLSMAKSRKNDALLSRVRQRIIERMVQQKRFAEVLPFYWNQIEGDQENERLLLEFIDFCKRYNIFEDAVRAYELAADRFSKPKYSDKLATYLLYKKRRDAFEDLTGSLAKTLDEADLKSYLDKRVYYGKWNSSETDFFERMYKTALKRFPHERDFLDRLLNYYARYENKYPDARILRTELLVKYFATDPKLARELCAELAAQDKLDAAVAEVMKSNEQNPVQMRFLAEAFGFQSRYEAQYGVVKILEQAYREVNLTGQAASLERSLDDSYYASDPKLTESSAKRYENLAERYPTHTDFATKAGEVYVEAGRQRSAASIWESMLKYEPGRDHSYLDLATLYWDYYLFEHALGVIEEGRKVNDNPLMLAKEAGYLQESMNRQDLAMVEYVHLICNGDGYDWEVEERVSRFEKDETKQKAMDEAFDHYLDRENAKSEEVLKYGQYLGNYNRRDRKTDVFKKYMDRFDDESFLITISDYFSGMGHGDLAEKALERLADASGRSTDVLLRLLAFYETNEKKENIASTCDELEALNGPDSLRHREILLRIAQARWEAGDIESALTSYKKLADASKGRQRDRNLYTYAERCLEGDHESTGEEILYDLADRNPADSRYYRTLADHYALNDQYEKLVALYTKAIGQTKKAVLFRAEKEDRIEAYRKDLANALVLLKRYTEALDQYIEVINLRAPYRSVTDEVYRYAQSRGQIPRLISYYEKLSKKSFKDYRWQVVLGDLYEMQGDSANAATQFEKAIHNEPQRLNLYDDWARALERSNDLTGALKALERRYELSGTEHDLQKVIEFAFRSGNREQGRELLLKQVEDSKTPTWRLFAAAKIFETYGEKQFAEQLLYRAVERFRDDPGKMNFRTDEMVRVAKVIASQNGFTAGYRFLDDMRNWLNERANQSSGLAREHLRQKMYRAESALKNDYARYLYDYAPPEEFESIETMLTKSMQKSVNQSAMSSIGGNRVDLIAQYYKSFAESARMASLKMGTLKARAKAYRYYEGNRSTAYSYRREVKNAMAEFRKLGDPAFNLKALIENSYARDYATEYRKEFAKTAFLADDQKLEKEALALLFTTGHDSGLKHPDSYERRYLDMLLQGDRQTLDSLAQKTVRPGMFTLYTLWRHEPDVALKAIDHHWKSKNTSWHTRRKIQVLEYANRDLEAKELYKQILGLPRKVQNLIDGKIDTATELTYNRWFYWAFKYGKLIARLKEDGSERFLISLAESKPKSSGSYIAMAEIQGDYKQWEKAAESIALAKQLSPKSEFIIKAEGDLYLKRGQRAKAAQSYRRLIEQKGESWKNFRTYYEWMKKADMKNQALASYMAYASAHLTSLSRWAQHEQLAFISTEYGAGKQSAEALKSILKKYPNEIHLFENVIYENLVPAEELGWFYAGAANRILSMPQYSVYSKIEWQKKVLDFAIEHKDLTLGNNALAAMEKLETSKFEQWQHRLKKAELDLVCQNHSSSLLDIAKECKDTGCYRELRQIAIDHQDTKTGAELEYQRLTFKLKKGYIGLDERVDLGRLCFEKGMNEKADLLLQYVAAQSDSTIESQSRISEIYLENKLPEKAMVLLKQAESRAPEDYELKLMHAIALMSLPEKTGEGIQQWSDIFAQGSVPRSKVRNLIENAYNKLKANNVIEAFQAAVETSTEEGTMMLSAYVCLEEENGACAKQALRRVETKRRYIAEYYDFMARACNLTKTYDEEVKYLTLGIKENPNRKDLIARRFFAWMELGMALPALDSLELWIPTKRFDLIAPLSSSASKTSVRSFAGKLGLAEKDADRLLEKTADGFIEIDRPVEAKTYLEVLKEKSKDENKKSQIQKRIKDLDEKISRLREKKKPWPVITYD